MSPFPLHRLAVDLEVAAYSEAIRAGNYEEARRIAAELRKANPKIDLKARRKNYEERVGVREKK